MHKDDKKLLKAFIKYAVYAFMLLMTLIIGLNVVLSHFTMNIK